MICYYVSNKTKYFNSQYIYQCFLIVQKGFTVVFPYMYVTYIGYFNHTMQPPLALCATFPHCYQLNGLHYFIFIHAFNVFS